MQTKNYNLIPLSIDQRLNRVPIGTAGGYIRLLEAPAAANVQIHLNEQNADGIPLKTYHAIEATNIEKIFVSCNAVAGESITIVQANTAKDFKMVTPASDVKLSSLGSYESVALDQLDKIINPYNIPTITQGGSSASGGITQLSKTTLSDKIRITLSLQCADTAYNGASGVIYLKINGIVALHKNDSNSYPTEATMQSEFVVNPGDTLEIYSYNADTAKTVSINYYLEEYTLK